MKNIAIFFIIILIFSFFFMSINKNNNNSRHQREVNLLNSTPFKLGFLLNEEDIKRLKIGIQDKDASVSNDIRNGLDKNSEDKFLVLEFSRLSKYECLNQYHLFQEYSDEIVVNTFLILNKNNEKIDHDGKILNLSKYCFMFEKNQISFIKYLSNNELFQ